MTDKRKRAVPCYTGYGLRLSKKFREVLGGSRAR